MITIEIKNGIKYVEGFLRCLLHGIQYSPYIYIGDRVKFVTIGKVLLGHHLIVRPNSHLFSMDAQSVIQIGDYTEIGHDSTISALNKVLLGKGVLLAPRVYIADHNHEYRNINKPIYQQSFRCNMHDEVVIGDGTWIGINSVIVGNVHIGKNCVVGANTFVNCDIPDYCVVVGNPCRIVKKYSISEDKWLKYELSPKK